MASICRRGVRIFHRVKGAERTVVVTDAMSAAGAPSGRYTIGDLEVEVGEDRVVRQPGAPFRGLRTHDGAGVAGFVKMAGVTLAEAWKQRRAALGTAAPAGAVKRMGESSVLARWRGGQLDVLATLCGGACFGQMNAALPRIVCARRELSDLTRT